MPNIRNTALSTGQTLYHRSLFDYVFQDENEDANLKDILDDIDISINNLDNQIKLIKINNQTSENNLNNHIIDTNNPHAVTKAQIGLANVDNTSDANKNVSSAKFIKDSSDWTTDITASIVKPQLSTFDSIGVWNDREIRSASFGAVANIMNVVTTKSDGAYKGLVLPNSDEVSYIRTTKNGFIPYQSGGHGTLGTAGWPFNTIYGNTLYEDGTSLANKYLGKSANAVSATKLQTARNINGTSFNGTVDITTAKWGTARTLTIGPKGKSIDGSANVSFTMAELGLDKVNNTADADKTVKSSKNVLDVGNNTPTTFAYSKEGLNTASWFAAWNGYELRAISPAKVLSTIGAAASSHTHSYLPLAGGTMDATKQISRAGNSVSWVAGRNGALIRQTSYTGYNPILSMKTTAGSWELGVYNDNRMHFSYITDANFNSGNNAQTVNMIVDTSGNLIVPKVTAAGGFIGNASTASKLRTARNITIGNKTKSFDGSGNISFSLDEIGAGGDIPEGLKTGYVLTGLKSGFSAGSKATGEGYETKPTGAYSHTEGSATSATSTAAHAEGRSTLADGEEAHAEGYGSKALREYSHAEGYFCEANDESAHAEGHGTQATSASSHSEGFRSIACGEMAHAEGGYTQSGGTYNGKYMHAEGMYTLATGNASHAGGSHTIARKYAQMAIGYYNKEDGAESNYNAIGSMFIIGYGTESARSNAFRVNYNGTAYGKAAFQTSGADYAEYYEWLDSNIYNEDRRGYFVTIQEDKIKIANSDDKYILGIVSAKPVVVGNCDGDEWSKRFVKDEFGAYIMEEIIEIDNNDEQIKRKVYVQNPDYDPNKEFISREDRPEWSPIGMLGVLVVRDDGTCKVNSYAKVADGGIATHSTDKNDYRVIKRVNDHLIKVIFR